MAKNWKHRLPLVALALLMAVMWMFAQPNSAQAWTCSNVVHNDDGTSTASVAGNYARVYKDGSQVFIDWQDLQIINGMVTFPTPSAEGIYQVRVADSSNGDWSDHGCKWAVIEATALGDYECDSQEWHFVITGLQNVELAPDFIWVEFSSGDIVQIARDATTQSSVAHYTYVGNLEDEVVRAWTSISVDFNRFNLSHGPGSCPLPPPVCNSVSVTDNLLTWSSTPEGLQSEVRNSGGTAVAGGFGSINIGSWIADTYFLFVTNDLGVTWSAQNSACSFTIEPPPATPVCLDMRVDRVSGTMLVFEYTPSEIGWVRLVNADSVVQGPISIGSGNLSLPTLPNTYWGQVSIDGNEWSVITNDCKVTVLPPPPLEPICVSASLENKIVSFTSVPANLYARILDGQANPVITGNGPFDVSELVPGPYSVQVTTDQENWFGSVACAFVIPPPPPPVETVVCEEQNGVWGIAYLFNIQRELVLVQEGTSPNPSFWLNGSGFVPLPGSGVWWWNVSSLNKGDYCGEELPPPPPAPVCLSMTVDQVSNNTLILEYTPQTVAWLRLVNADSVVQGPISVGSGNLSLPTLPNTYWGQVSVDGEAWSVITNNCKVTVPELPPPPPTPSADCVSEWENGSLVRFGVRYNNIPASELVTTYRPGVVNERYTTGIEGAGFVMFAREGEDMTLGPWGWEIASANLSGSCGGIVFLPIIGKQPPPPPEPEPEPVYGCRWLTAADVVLVEGKAELESSGARTIFHNRLANSTVELNIDPGQYGFEVFSADNEVKASGSPARWLRPTGEVPLEYTGDMQIAASSVPGGPFFDTNVRVIGATADSPGVAICRWEEITLPSTIQ